MKVRLFIMIANLKIMIKSKLSIIAINYLRIHIGQYKWRISYIKILKQKKILNFSIIFLNSMIEDLKGFKISALY